MKVLKSLFSIVAMKSIIAHNSKHLAQWISDLQLYQGMCGLLWSAAWLIVLFIVCLCWLMAQCYVRREERLPQTHAGHTVNPSTRPYWLTEVPSECCCNAQDKSQNSLPTVCAPVFRYQQSTPHLKCLPESSTQIITPCCVWPGWTSPVLLSRYHRLCLYSVCSAWTPCWFYPSAAVWESLGKHFFSPLSFLNLYTHKAWAIRHALVCVSTLS